MPLSSFRPSRAFSAWAVLVVIATAIPIGAQPPALSRWSGSTAITPVQGYSQGSPLTLTWGFMLDGSSISGGVGEPAAGSNLRATYNSIYGSQSVWQPLFQSSFDRWASISGLSYQFEANDDGSALSGSAGVLGVRADVRIGGHPIDGNFGILAYNYFPNTGDMVIDTGDSFFGTAGSPPASINLTNVVAHEHGHGIGMPHVVSNNATFLMNPFFSSSFNGPQYHDILAAQRMYGDANEKSFAGLGNDVAARATVLGTLAVDGTAQLKVGQSAKTFVVASTATDFVSIDDASDTDFYSFSILKGGRVSVLLETLGFNYNVTDQNGNGDVPFDTKSRSDLTLALLGADGITVLNTSNVNGLGGNESLFFDFASAGTFFLRVTGVNNGDAITLDTQFYGLFVGFAPVPEPAGWGMVALVGVVFVGRGRLRRGQRDTFAERTATT